MRERLIGAIVLIVIAAIMVPLLMSHAHNPRKHLRDEHLRDVALAAAPPASTPPALAIAPVATSAGAKSGAGRRIAGAPRSALAPASAALAQGGSVSEKTPPPRVARTSAPAQTAAGAVVNRPTPERTPVLQPVTRPAPARSTSTVAEEAVPKSPTRIRENVSRQEAPPRTSVPEREASAPEPSLGRGILHKGDWYVQVASFASHANAAQMAILLTRAGYHAFLSSNESGGMLYYRVRVGPYPSETRAQAVAPGLSAISGSKVIVRQADGSDG